MKMLAVLALAIVAVNAAPNPAYPHTPAADITSYCESDKVRLEQGRVYAEDNDCSYYWQCDYAKNVLKDVVLVKASVGNLWDQEILSQVPCGPSVPAHRLERCRIQFPAGEYDQCPVDPTQATTTQEPRPDIGRCCVLKSVGHEYCEIIGEEHTYWSLTHNATVSCDWLVFNLDPCGCGGKQHYPIVFPFDANLNAVGNTIFAAAVPEDAVPLDSDAGCAVFNESGHLEVPYFKNLKKQQEFSIALSYEQGSSGACETILSNTGFQGEQASLFVSDSSGNVLVELDVEMVDGTRRVVSGGVTVTGPSVNLLIEWNGYELYVNGNVVDSVPREEAGIAQPPCAIYWPTQTPLSVGYDAFDRCQLFTGKMCDMVFDNRLRMP